jgi:hypothetical protein
MGKHDIEDDAVEHEAQLNKAYPDNHVWTCVESDAIEDKYIENKYNASALCG